MSHNRNSWPIGRLLTPVQNDRYVHVSKTYRYVDDRPIFSRGETLKAGRRQAKCRQWLVKLVKQRARRALKKSTHRP